MNRIYAAITPKLQGYYTSYRKPSDYYNIYDLITFLIKDEYTQSETHKIAANAASWCELACIGETYEHKLFTIKIIEQ